MKSNKPIIIPSQTNDKNMERYLHKKLSDIDEGGGGGGGGQGNDPNAVHFTQQNLTEGQKTQARTNIGAGTYSKPSDGIPSSDMTSAVQTSLGKADTAYQKPTNGIPASDMEAGVIPDAVEANPTVPSGTTPTDLTGLKVGDNYFSVPAITALTNAEIDTIWNTAMA